MKQFVSVALIFLLATPALAESCSKSRDYILEGLAGDLPRPGSIYQALFKDCLEVLTFPNVKDAYVLKDGGIAIDARRNSLAATATTLARFCERFPSGTARFFTQQEKNTPHTVGLIVMMSSTGAVPCAKIRGGS
jgi:hypothetical protein